MDFVSFTTGIREMSSAVTYCLEDVLSGSTAGRDASTTISLISTAVSASLKLTVVV